MNYRFFSSFAILCLFCWLTGAAQNSSSGKTRETLSFSLDQAQTFAYENNYDLKNSTTDVEIARKVVKQNTAIGLPQVSGSVDYTDYIMQPTTMIPGEFFGKPAGSFYPVTFGTTYNMSLKGTLSQLIYSGQYLVGLQTAKAYLETSKQKNVKDKVDIRDQVADAYIRLLVVDQALQILDSTYIVVSRLVAEAKKSYENGLIEDIDVEQADLNRINLEAQVEDTRNARNVAYAGLKFLVGLKDNQEMTMTDNLRPAMERENLAPSRAMIQDLFLEHVMAQAPGYNKLIPWTDADIMPTPAAVGAIMQEIARREGINVVGVDIGGATTDVFSVFDGQFNRTVSANLGMSYSISNVLAEAGIDDILRWVPLDIPADRLGNRVRNKMIRPTTVPQNLEGLKIEQAVSREALRLAFEQHKMLATGLKGVQQQHDISDAFSQQVTGRSLIKMPGLDLLVGSGGVLSHAPRREQAAMMLVDAFEPEGLTGLAVDSIFMMPQLGVLAQVHPEAATHVFLRDCLIPLGACIAPINHPHSRLGKPGSPGLTVRLTRQGGTTEAYDVPAGEIRLVPLPVGETADVTVEPARGLDCGGGQGRPITGKVDGGVVGLVIDARGRPVRFAADPEERKAQVAGWQKALGAYPG